MYIPIEPVTVWETGTIRRTLADVEGAASFLLIKWPKAFMDTIAHREAQIQALEALGGHAPSEAFRAAFIEAAMEADILVPPSDVWKPIPSHVARPWDFQKARKRR